MKRDKLKNIARAIHRHNKRRHDPVAPAEATQPQPINNKPTFFTIGRSKIGGPDRIGSNDEIR